MHYKIIKTSKYELDILNIIDYLEDNFVSKKIMSSLFSEILWTINSLNFIPERFSEIFKDYRRALVKNYSIFYKIDENKKEVIIYRILHQSQNFIEYLK